MFGTTDRHRRRFGVVIRDGEGEKIDEDPSIDRRGKDVEKVPMFQKSSEKFGQSLSIAEKRLKKNSDQFETPCGENVEGLENRRDQFSVIDRREKNLRTFGEDVQLTIDVEQRCDLGKDRSIHFLGHRCGEESVGKKLVEHRLDVPSVVVAEQMTKDFGVSLDEFPNGFLFQSQSVLPLFLLHSLDENQKTFDRVFRRTCVQMVENHDGKLFLDDLRIRVDLAEENRQIDRSIDEFSQIKWRNSTRCSTDKPFAPKWINVSFVG